MTTDIKAVVAELERLEREWQSYPMLSRARGRAFTLYSDALWDHCPALITELRRLWAKEARQQAIEEAAVSLREAHEGPEDADDTWGFWFALARFFAALDAKPAKEEP